MSNQENYNNVSPNNVGNGQLNHDNNYNEKIRDSRNGRNGSDKSSSWAGIIAVVIVAVVAVLIYFYVIEDSETKTTTTDITPAPEDQPGLPLAPLTPSTPVEEKKDLIAVAAPKELSEVEKSCGGALYLTLPAANASAACLRAMWNNSGCKKEVTNSTLDYWRSLPKLSDAKADIDLYFARANRGVGMYNDYCGLPNREVFLVAPLDGSYSFTFADAMNIAREFKADIATPDQLAQAQEEGSQACGFGWLADGTMGYPMQVADPNCGNTKGVIKRDGVKKDSDKAHVFLYGVKPTRSEVMSKYASRYRIMNWYVNYSNPTDFRCSKYTV